MESLRDPSLAAEAAHLLPRQGRPGAHTPKRHCLVMAVIALAAFALSLLLPIAHAPTPDPMRPKARIATQRLHAAEYADDLQRTQHAHTATPGEATAR